MSAKRPRQPSTPEGMRLKREDYDSVARSWTVYGVYLDGVRIGSINGPDTAGWSVCYGPTSDAETAITYGWSKSATRYDACWTLRQHHQDALRRAAKTGGETR